MLKRLSDNSETILKERYYLKNSRGRVVEDWPALCKRVVDFVVPEERLVEVYKYTKKEAKKIREQIFAMINDLYFLPNSPALFNSGTTYPMLSACFVLDVEDDLEKIYESVKESALIHKYGGGVGTSFENLRVMGSKIKSTHGGSSGAVSFMRAFSHATAVVTAGGRRHGANMGILPCWHGDIEDFLVCKAIEGELHNFNISVAITDEFMSAVEKDLDWDLIDPKDGKVVKTLKAKDLMNRIVHGAWENGEPGVCFIDRVNEDNPTPQLGRIKSSNPCGEFYSLPYNSCNLGSINLTKFVENKKFQFAKFKKYIKLATLFLDCVVDVCKYPLEKIDTMTKATRPVGLGCMGWADCLILMNIAYDSKKAFDLSEDIAEVMGLTSLSTSADLAKIVGPYPAFLSENHTYKKYISNSKKRKSSWNKLVKKINEVGLRNSHTLVQAPTGTLSRIAGVSFGIEPNFSFNFESAILDGKTIIYKHPLYESFERGDLNVDKRVFVSAKDIKPDKHLEAQYHWQRFVHNGISKTINMSNTATEDDVLSIYLLAHKLGLKGVTVYREGSRKEEVIVDIGKRKRRGRKRIDIDKEVLKRLVEEDKMPVQRLSEIFDCSTQTIRSRLNEYGITVIDEPEEIERPDELVSRTFKVKTDLGNLYVAVGEDPETNQPLETIINISKSGTDLNALAEAVGKLISKALQQRANVMDIINTLEGIGGETVSFWRAQPIKSIPDAIAKILKTYVNGHKESENTHNVKGARDLKPAGCPVCGAVLVIQEGCESCSICSYSKCGGK